MIAPPVAIKRLAGLACIALLPVFAAGAGAADPAPLLHGSADAFAAPGVVLAWGVLRGASEASTQVVIRIEADPSLYASIAVAGVDPFTGSREMLLPPTRFQGAVEFRSLRSRYADLPRNEFRLYRAGAPIDADTPALVVYYLGVPDTTPEFTDERKLAAYLADRIVRARRESGAKSP